MKPFCVIRAAAGAAGIALASHGAHAAMFVVSHSSGHLAASASFDVDPSNASRLIVTLANTSMHDVLVPADILTAVFFSITNPTVVLLPVSAVLGPGSTVQFGAAPGGVVGGEWAYRSGLTGVVEDIAGVGHGISSAGFGLFGAANFPGSNLQGPVAVNGMQYGITSTSDNPATGNAAVTGMNAFIKNEVVFTLSGLPEGFDPASSISGVMFQYGTSLEEPRLASVPAPGAAALMGIAFASLMRRRR